MELHIERFDGLLRGAVGSVAGLAAMALFFRAAEKLNGSNGAAGGTGEEGFMERQDALHEVSVVGEQAEEDEAATEAVARIGYQAAAGHDPDERLKQRLGHAVHYGYGVLLGGVYGAMREDAEAPDLLGGLGYGTAAWVLGDEITVPLLGLAEGPTSHGWKTHATALGAHLAYGAATAGATHALRRMI